MTAGSTRNIVDPNGIQGLSGIKLTEQLENSSKTRRPNKRPSSPERWELAQLKHAGVLKVEDYPDFDEEGAVSTSHLMTPFTSVMRSCCPLLWPCSFGPGTQIIFILQKVYQLLLLEAM